MPVARSGHGGNVASAGSGAGGCRPADSTAWRKAVNTLGRRAGAKGNAMGSSRLDCHTTHTLSPAARSAASSSSSSGAAIASHTTACAPTVRASAGSTSHGAPCSSSSALPRARKAASRSSSAASRKARRCGPRRAKPQRVGASAAGSWQ